MIDGGKLLSFVAATLALIAVPGPAVVFLVTRSLSEGRTVAVLSASGVALGNLAHALMAAFGVTALLAATPVALGGLKWAGALYLVYMGIRILMTKSESPSNSPKSKNCRSPFVEGIWVGLLNPKVALFLVAFLPQFASQEAGPMWIQLLMLGSLFVLLGWIGDSAWAFFSGIAISRIAGKRGSGKTGRTLSGLVYVVLGVILVIT